ncbi:MAG: mannitol 2-dehydrogenase [Saprospiraceae bacterium]|jgi:mannitol 2-dehydrogenase
MEITKSLNSANLSDLTDRISGPSYNRENLNIGIVHIGVGGFHRAHQAYYLHQLHEQNAAPEWGICGIGIREADRKIYDILKKQNELYTLVIKHPDGKVQSQVIGSIVDFLLGADHPNKVIERMAHSNTKIVSLTITEGGYNFNAATGGFDFDNRDIQHECEHPNEPKTVYGFLTASLKKRRDAGLSAYTIMSCDNIQHNGDLAREMLLTFARKQDSELAKWIEEEVSFPNTMVDRITPVTTQDDINYLSDTYQITDEWPVTCEPFIQWIIEDNFSNGRPGFEKVGVQFVQDVTPYEKMKLRLLNAGHSVLGILGAIHGHQTINACMDDEVFVSYMNTFLHLEASPILEEVPGINLADYIDSLKQRFANPNIKDSVTRICTESSAKLPKFLIATIRENLAIGGSIQFATLVIAAWCYYSDKGMNKNQEPLEIIDALQSDLHEAAKSTPVDSLAFLRQDAIFGDLINNEVFTRLYISMVKQLYIDSDVRELMREML